MLLVHRWFARPSSLVLLSACGISEPRDVVGDNVLWDVPGEMSTMPLVVDSLLIGGLVDGRLVAFDRRNGRIVWQTKFPVEFRSERLLRVGNTLIVANLALHGVDARTGAVTWTYGGTGGDAGIVTPGLSGDTVYVAGYLGGDAAALEAATGRVLWQAQIQQTVFCPTITESLALYPTRNLGQSGALVALDRLTGEERWRRVLPDSANFPGGTVYGGAVAGDRVVLGTYTSRVLALSLADGALRWEQVGGSPTTAPYHAAPRVTGSNVLFTRGDAVLEGRSAADGTLQWSLKIGGSLTSTPSPCAPYLCLAQGRVWIIDPSGKIVWAFGGGSEIVFLSNVVVDADGVMYAGVVRANRTGGVRAFRPPVAVGATP